MREARKPSGDDQTQDPEVAKLQMQRWRELAALYQSMAAVKELEMKLSASDKDYAAGW